jgi:hypothetical protein
MTPIEDLGFRRSCHFFAALCEPLLKPEINFSQPIIKFRFISTLTLQNSNFSINLSNAQEFNKSTDKDISLKKLVRGGVREGVPTNCQKRLEESLYGVEDREDYWKNQR